MGMSCITRNLYPILSLLLLILVTIPSSSSYSPKEIVTKKLLNKLCQQPLVLDHRFCIKWLTTDHKTTSITLHRLIEVVVDKTRESGLNNQKLMKKYAGVPSKDKQLKKAYAACVSNYRSANKELKKAKELLTKSSFTLAHDAVYRAFDYAYSCKDEFEGPSAEPQVVWTHVDKFIQMCHISKAFAGLLSHT